MEMRMTPTHLRERAMMEQAIEESLRSENESPTNPLVGAVLVSNNLEIFLDHRSNKQHAEFRLLQYSLRSTTLTQDGTLFTTLEPCTTRGHEKKPCVQWVIDKGIKRVFIGILDPNPDICGRGYWKLIDAGIQVEMFPADLAQRIRDTNRRFISQHRSRIALSTGFQLLLRQNTSAKIATFPGFGWGACKSIVECPDKREGWLASTVEIHIDPDEPFELPSSFSESYSEYYQRCYVERGFHIDGEKLMLVKNPVVFSDAQQLKMNVRPTRYSHAMYYADQVSLLERHRSRLVNEFMARSLLAEFPHRLCLQLIVVTSDGKILLTQRSAKSAEEKGMWSASLEEQIKRIDIEKDPNHPCVSWIQRTLSEELDLSDATCSPEGMRVMSVFLEVENLNVSVLAHAKLRCDAEDMVNHLRHSPRFKPDQTYRDSDYEYSDVGLLEVSKPELLHEIFLPMRQYHFSSPYRLMYFYLKTFGEPSAEDLAPFLGKR
jgi:pyrimidine deaminase RibD-like protein